MPKFYVRSGDLERIVYAIDPYHAAEIAIADSSGEYIDKYFFYVDERGFRGPKHRGNSIDTLQVTDDELNLKPEFIIKIEDVLEVEGED